jgi:hypothetical protein
MLQAFKKILALLILLCGVIKVGAFSLLGPFEGWMTSDIGYNKTGDIGGPMNLGEEYRWNVPTLVYAYDSAFLDYFGQRGVEAVEQAIQILNSIPSISQFSTDLSEFPLDTRRFNHQARALGLLDLKSFALSGLLEEMGLTSPDRYTWAIRQRVVIANIPNYLIIKRNFDPVTLTPSSYVNGTLYTYQILQVRANPDEWEAVEIAVDPFAPSVTAVTSLLGQNALAPTDFRGQATLSSSGLFFTGLTRDDVGGLRYLYNRSNLNMENLPTNAVGGSFGGAINVGGGGGGGSPWTPVPTSTNAATGGGVGGGAGAPVTVNTAVITALRPGVDKITFVRANYNSVLGGFFTNNVAYSDVFYTNGTARSQNVTKRLTAPDIVFSAAELPVANASPTIIARLNTASAFINNTGITSADSGLGGPGQIDSVVPVSITFGKIGPAFFNAPEGTQETAAFYAFWGSFDGSTNAPIVYPNGASIQDLERAIGVRSANNSRNSGRIPTK